MGRFRARRGTRRFAPALWLAVLVVTVGAAASVGAAAVLATGQRSQAQQQLVRRTAQVAAAAETGTGRYLDALRTVAASAGAFDTLTAPKFDQVTGPLADMRLAGASSIVYLVASRDDRVAATQALWRSRGVPGLVLRPEPGAAEHIFTIMSRPLDGGDRGGRRAGIDATRAAAPLAALRAARRTGRIAVSDAYELIIDRDLPRSRRQLSFVLTAPVYSKPDATGSRAFSGWVLMGLRGQDFLGTQLAEASQNLLDVTLSANDADGRPVTVAALHSGGAGRRDLSRTVTIPVADRTWRLRVDAHGPALPGVATGLPTVVAAAGSLLGLLLAGLVFVLATSRTRAQQRVREATADLALAESRARDQAGLLEAIMNSISDGVAVVDGNGQFLLHNPAARAMLGVDDAGGPERWQSHYGFYLPDGGTAFPTDQLPLVRALAGDSTEQVEMVVRNAARPDGITLSVSGRPLHDHDGHIGAVAVFHDITDRKAAEVELRDREADLRAFAGVAAHDLKSPLTAVSGFAELLDDGLATGADPAALRPVAARIVAGVGRMRRLIDDLLAYATVRDGRLDTQPVDLAALVAEVLAERTAHLRTARPGDGLFPDVYTGPLPVVHADPAMTRQLLDNLIGNALKYTLPGQPPRIDISAHSRDGDGWARVEIADRGVGIPEADQPHVFTSFHRAAQHTNDYAGTGLGLAICHRVIDRHGGQIGVTDNPGGGTRVWFTLPTGPVAPPPTPAVAPADAPAAVT